LVKDKLGYKYHWALADYLQRSARHIASATDVEQAYAVGRAAVEAAINGKNAVMPAISRISDAPYQWEITLAELSEVANQEKKLPREFITPDGFHITDLCRRYLAPLIAGEDFPPFRNGLPDYVRLCNSPVTKKLKEFVL
jgi:6-phosphofructokinase 1